MNSTWHTFKRWTTVGLIAVMGLAASETRVLAQREHDASDILWRCLPKRPATACGNAPEGSNAIWQFESGHFVWTTWLGGLIPSWKVQGVDRFGR